MEQLHKQILEWVNQDRGRIVSLFSKLVQCRTPSVPGDTRSAASLVKEYLKQEGLAFREVNANEIMPNLISAVNMKKPGRHLMFNGHLDVMPAGKEPGWTDEPWSGKITDGKVWGRGSSDMKAGVTSLLFAYIYLARLRGQLRGKLSLTLVSDEETGYERGTGYLFEQMGPEMLADCVLSGEPSGADTISFASKGYIQFTVAVTTRGALAGYSGYGKSAIEIAADVIRDLKVLEQLEVGVPEHIVGRSDEEEFLRKITVDITTIRGGDLISVNAPKCSFTAAVVVPVGTDPYRVVSRAQEIVSRYPEATLILDGISPADCSAPDGEMVGILQDTVTGLGWKKPKPVADIAISDCRHWRYRGIPAYWYGPNGDRCSAADEYVEIEELLHLVRTHTIAAVRFLTAPVPAEKPTLPNLYTSSPVLPCIKKIAAMYAACISGTTNSFRAAEIDPLVNQLLDTLYLRLAEANILPGAAMVTMKENKANKCVEVTASVPVDREISTIKGLDVRELPEINVAVAPHYGAGSTSKTWANLRRFVSSQGRRPMGIYREIYLVTTPNPANTWITELQLTLKD